MEKKLSHSSDLTQLKGVGPKVQERLSKLGLNNIQDILFHLPYRYEDRTRVVPVGVLRHGQSALIEVTVDYTKIAFTRKGKSRRMLLLHVTDGTGSLLLRFFYFNKQQQETLKEGIKLRCFGDVRYGSSSLEIVHPEYFQINENTAPPVDDSLTPVYHTADGVSQILLRRLTGQCLELLNNDSLLPDYLNFPVSGVNENYSLVSALRYVHRPPSGANVNQLFEVSHESQLRLIFEELLAQHLSLKMMREKNRRHSAAHLSSDNHFLYQFLKSLPFDLTMAQQKVNQDILQDLESGVPMMRLVQGDVGSGKTVVAALACLKAIESGSQAAIMAPTEILAEQHYKNFTAWFKPLGIEVAWLSGQIKGKKRDRVLRQISDGGAQVIVGTHALFQSDVKYKNLALAVTDEQHRFGVQQRMALAKKAHNEENSSNNELAHQLIMTATPIPRSLAMTAYADLDYSVIDELPPGRKPITTVVIQQERREEILDRIYKACAEGKQAYWVCTLVEESESLQCQAAQDTAEKLQEVFPDIKVGLIHGRLKSDEKASLMQSFQQGDIKLLVATTVIEVGVDVPNASLMIIENAERLGLSQLHQLRGRVGRGEEASHCVLMFKSPLSEHAKERLAIMRKTNSGFEIARKDLQLRGPGEVLGTRQTGLVQFKIADIVRDEYMLDDVKRVATNLIDSSPESIKPLIDRWVGIAQQYVNVG
ncbi:MAG: ATP-dependent DNA helicase RecG [endosymbiont of Galathealinum brachiosum]|uniref:ATP-dependent DNA helicase RecG n=1 Tax=endosymbiont of Galathealinum brachiosum TaxID=2200906 RepID=A0A370DEH6_9GAMM|nr:MAG: ATP-dependent DNA helicase RecG [endosymbiont of Galathealinum brachiosum]